MLKTVEYRAPVARIFTSNDMPPGLWTRNEHWFTPLTPLCADFQVASECSRGFNGGMDELALPTPRFDFVVIDGYGYQAMRDPDSAPSPDLLAAFEDRVHAHHESTLIREWQEFRRADVETQLERVRVLELRPLSDDQLLWHIRELSEHTVELCRIHFANILATGIIVGRLGMFCNERLQMTDGDVFRMFAGASDASRRATTELEQLARVVRESPWLKSALDGPDPWANREVQELLQPYLEAYGRQAVEFEFSTPTLVEQPERAVRLLQNAVRRLEPTRMRPSDVRQHWANRLADEMDLREFDRLLAEALQAYSVRDDDANFVMLAWGFMRRALLEAGRRLAEQGVLRTTEDVWYLRRAELEQVLSGVTLNWTEIDENVRHRRSERERQLAAGLPPFTAGVPTVRTGGSGLAGLSSEAQYALAALAWARRHGGAPASAGLTLEQQSVRGAGASAGVYTGIARVIRGESEFDRVRPGEVLVCPFTSPTWTVLFGTVGAIVTNEGGLLSHPAITAREFGIPAVVGTRVATDVVPDGSVVTVDGATGTLTVHQLA